jgi:chromosome segregation ATPase
MSRLEPLAQQIDKIQISVKTYSEIIEQTQKDLQITYDAISGLQGRLDMLKKELAEAESRMQDYVDQQTRLLNDIQESQANQKEELDRIDDIKNQMRSILGAA